MKTYSIDKSKLYVDSLLNLAVFFILGVSGLAVNIIIVRNYPPEVLGIFNQVYAIYVIFSQLAVFGVQMSVLKYVAQYAHTDKKDKIISAAIYITIVSATLFVGLLSLLEGFFGWLLKSSDVGVSLGYVFVALWCYTLNKIFMSVLNSLEKMKSYALLSCLGYQSLLFILLCGTGIFLNFLLVPFFGMSGTAVATALSGIAYVFYLKLFAFRLFKLKM
ncbi:MAG: oligosaccharide flippase family protein [bacterium]|nr:oligosaccharide flippase family protein [bacterium]